MYSSICNGFCTATCSHPSCWNYYRNLLRNHIDVLENSDSKKQLSIVVPHQSILNINSDLIPNRKIRSKSPSNNSNHKNNNDILEYLSSRKKLTPPNVPHVTPHSRFINENCKTLNTFLRETTNTSKSPPKISQLDVHELFDFEELQSDWKKTFNSKDYYVWFPSSSNDRDSKIKRETTKISRSVKTPVLQLAPVMESQFNSSRKNTSSLSGSSELFNKTMTSKKNLKKIYRKTLENNFIGPKEPENFKENIHRKLLESTLFPSKMPIHNINDRSFNKYDSFLNNQIYVLDQSNSNLHFNKFFYNQNTNSPKPPYSSVVSVHGHNNTTGTKQLPLNFRGVSIIGNSFTDDSLDLKLGPQRFTIDTSRTQSSVNTKNSDKSSFFDSMMTNALSDRSTLNDNDLFPGSNMLQLLQKSYKLVKERSDIVYDEVASKLVPVTIEELQLGNNSKYPRSTKSASGNNFLAADIPTPPPPSPEIFNRFRSISAAAELNRDHQQNNA